MTIDKSTEIIGLLREVSDKLDTINLSSIDTAFEEERLNVLEIKSLLRKVRLTTQVNLDFANKNFGTLLHEGIKEIA